MIFDFGVRLPMAWEIFWRAARILKKRNPEDAFSAIDQIRSYINEFAEQRLQEEISSYLNSHANALYERGGWELGYFPDHYKDDEGTYHVSKSDIAYLLENWPDSENLPDGYPTEVMSDIDALGEILCLEGWNIGDLPGYTIISDAECYALLAQEKVYKAQRQVGGNTPASTVPKELWKVKDVLIANSLLVEAMECVCSAERYSWEAQMSKLSTERAQREEVEMRRDIRKSLAQAGAQKKLTNDPKQAAKQQVRECWDLWQKEPVRYKSKSAFARDMLAKFDDLESQRVIERWCKDWESGPS